MPTSGSPLSARWRRCRGELAAAGLVEGDLAGVAVWLEGGVADGDVDPGLGGRVVVVGVGGSGGRQGATGDAVGAATVRTLPEAES